MDSSTKEEEFNDYQQNVKVTVLSTGDMFGNLNPWDDDTIKCECR